MKVYLVLLGIGLACAALNWWGQHVAEGIERRMDEGEYEPVVVVRGVAYVVTSVRPDGEPCLTRLAERMGP